MNNLHRYILDEDGEPVLEPDVLRWGQWFETHRRQSILAKTFIPGGREVLVSTVFLGINHRFGSGGVGEPVLWETVVFGGALDGEMRRYSSREAALAGHEEMVRAVREAEAKGQP